MRKTKLKLSRQTVRLLSNEPLAAVAGGIHERPTKSCATNCCVSIFNSCRNSDCCLEVP